VQEIELVNRKNHVFLIGKSCFASELPDRFMFWPVSLTPKSSFGLAWSDSLEKSPGTA
jgi:hypothetical protein